jgi:hypothetical protein
MQVINPADLQLSKKKNINQVRIGSGDLLEYLGSILGFYLHPWQTLIGIVYTVHGYHLSSSTAKEVRSYPCVGK